MNRDGSRKIELLIPFEHLGLKYDAITIRPILFDHTLRWQRGEFRNMVQLLAALTGQQESVLRMMRYPDVDRVVRAFIEMLPNEIATDLVQGKIPMSLTGPPTATEEEPPAAEPELPAESEDGSRLLEEDAA